MNIIGTDPFITIYCCTIIFIVGAVFGSFLHCMAWRMTHGESVLRGRSQCPNCGHVLGARELIPIFSFLIQKGKCRACGEKISLRYPVAEFVLGIMSVMMLFRFDVSFELLRGMVFLFCLFTLTITDLDDMIIPDGLLIAMVIDWIIFVFILREGLWSTGARFLSALLVELVLLIIVLLFEKIIGKEAMGGGDIKLIAVCTLFTGAVGALLMILVACVVGLIFAAITSTQRVKGKVFPFGPSIALAAWLVVMYGNPLITWYLNLL